MPRFTNYGNYSSNNYGVNTLRFDIDGLTIWFSYKTPVAFDSVKTGFVIRENDWSTTTGKHLNWINDNHSIRVTGDEFQEKLQEAMCQ